MTRWYKFCYRHSWLVATAISIVLIVILGLIAGCDPNTGNGGSMPNCPFGQHIASKFVGNDVKWYCAKGP